MHELTAFMHDNHRLVLSGEKTRILPVSKFLKTLRDPEAEEKKRFKTDSEERAMQEYYEELIETLDPYGVDEEDFDQDRYNEVLSKVQEDKRHEILSEVYVKAINEELASPAPEFAVLRNILRRAGKYRVRSILESVLNNFERLLPLIREVVFYLVKVINRDLVGQYTKQFNEIVGNPRMQLPFLNTWLATLLQHPAFNAIDLPADYKGIRSLRSQALIAIRREDRTWVKGQKNNVDTLGPWEKRAVLYSGKILSGDERGAWMKVASKRGTILEKAVTQLVAKVK